MKFNFKPNPVTGIPQAQFQAKLVAPLSEKTLANVNQKNYKIATVEFENAAGDIQRASAAIYEGNYGKGALEVGKQYLTTVSVVTDDTGSKAYLQMSHLESAALASADDFGFDINEVGVAANPLVVNAKAESVIQ